MPNHITNWVEIKGSPEKMADLKSRIRTSDEPNQFNIFDFNGIIPMPKSLNMESSSQVDLGLAALGICGRFDDKDPLGFYKSCAWWSEKYPGINTPEDFKAFLEKSGDPQDQKILELGKQAKDNLEKYGCSTWYDWCVDNWGTKWNAYAEELLNETDTSMLLRFDTAWSSPYPIFDKLVEEGFEVGCCWQDEGGPSGAYGDITEELESYADIWDENEDEN